MNIISAFFKGILYVFSFLTPLSYEGMDGLIYYTNFNLITGGYDSILPIITSFSVILAIVYFLKSDLFLLYKTSGCLLKDIKEKKLNLDTKEEDKKHLLMFIFGSFTLVFTPLFELLFKGMRGNTVIISLGLILSAFFIIMSGFIKEKNLKSSNETILNAVSVSVFRMLSIIPGLSGVAGMYFISLVSGFTKEFAFKFTYLITLVWAVFSFIRNIIMLFIHGVTVNYGVFYYIFFTIGAIGISGFSIYLFKKSIENKKTHYFGIFNIILAIITFLIFIRG